MNYPLITLILPTKNEEFYIENCLNSLIKCDYDFNKIEILVIDGLSTDRTIEIVNSYISKYPFIRLLSNPGKTFPCAVNIGFKQSKGEAIFILGAHAYYDSKYLIKCTKNLFELGADNVGGVLNTLGTNKSLVGNGITIILSEPFGVGNATFRTGSDKIMEVDTVFGGCYRRDVIDRIGYFNENLVSSSDMDFNTRLRKAGGKIFLLPEIKATYYTRSTFKNFLRNNIRNGYWVIYPIRFLSYVPFSFRHFVPLIFLLLIIIGLFLSFFSQIFIYFLIVLFSVYFLTALIISSKYVKQSILNLVLLPFLFFTLHIAYGIGSLWGFLKFVSPNKKRVNSQIA